GGALPWRLIWPAAGVATVRYAVLPIALRPTMRTGQPRTAIFVLCLTTLPFQPVIVVGMTSELAHRLPKPASAECEPVGRFTVTLDTGTSGVVAKLVVVMPFLMFVLPTTIVRTPSASMTRSRSGNAAAAWETRIAGPFSLSGRRGVLARAPPTNEPLGHLNGSAANTASGQAFCSVVRREGSCLGSCTSTDLMFAWPAAWLIVVSRLAPLAFEVLALVVALNDALKPTLSH